MVKMNEKVFVELIDIPIDFTEILIEKIYEQKAFPFLNIKSDKLIRAIGQNEAKEYYNLLADMETYCLKKMDAFIGIKNVNNAFELSDLNKETVSHFRKEYLYPVHFDYRNNNLKWVYLRWPSESMAQRAEMSTNQFLKYYFDACLFDFSKVKRELNILKNLMQNSRFVRILGPGETNINFEMIQESVILSLGSINLPDGEIFTAPVKDSMNGTIIFNTPSVYHGKGFDNIKLQIKNGKITYANCDNNRKALNEILNTDSGSSYFGEFAIGLNPLIKIPINEIVFDEKIFTSIHLAIGNSYKIADNGNRSAIHWDLILNQSNEYGGGEMYFDDVLVKRNGLFVIEELELLNKTYRNRR